MATPEPGEFEHMNGDRATPVPGEPPPVVDDGTLIALLRAQSTYFASVFVRLDRVEEGQRRIEEHLQRQPSEAALLERIRELEGKLAAKGAP